ncbi:hypothetical protein EZS27_033524 [termite gut metagenome]|uniref:AbiEi antitoxin C-terminal domain-containing protein n=1 Tax=termite gut metagenome TaxID=433724 RepID=A0A5J4Q546_9ZZZZ
MFAGYYFMKKRLYNGKPTVMDRILFKIQRSKKSVFVPADFEGISSYPQILRALKLLIKEKQIIRFGYGSYVKAEINPLNNKVYPVQDMISIVQELFNKLKIDWAYSQAVKDYNEGKSTQVPVNGLLVIKSRFARKLEGANDICAKY